MLASDGECEDGFFEISTKALAKNCDMTGLWQTVGWAQESEQALGPGGEIWNITPVLH